MNVQALQSLIQTLELRQEEFRPSLDEVDHMIARLEGARGRGYLSKAELFDLCRVKSTRRAKEACKNTESDVNAITKLSFTVEREEVRIGLLCSLTGVLVPTASCILSWTFPKKWAVIDQRAWRSLFDAGVFDRRANGTPLRPAEWVDYCKAVDVIADALSLTPQRVDRLLYALDKSKQKSQQVAS